MGFDPTGWVRKWQRGHFLSLGVEPTMRTSKTNNGGNVMATQGQDFFRALAVAVLLAVFAMGVLIGATRYAVANDDEPVDVQIATACYVERGSEMVCE